MPCVLAQDGAAPTDAPRWKSLFGLLPSSGSAGPGALARTGRLLPRPARLPAWSRLALAQAPTTRSWSVAARPSALVRGREGPKLEGGSPRASERPGSTSGSTSSRPAGTEAGPPRRARSRGRMAATLALFDFHYAGRPAASRRIPDQRLHPTRFVALWGLEKLAEERAQSALPSQPTPSGRRRTLPACASDRAVPAPPWRAHGPVPVTHGVRVLESGMEELQAAVHLFFGEIRSAAAFTILRTRIRHRHDRSLTSRRTTSPAGGCAERWKKLFEPAFLDHIASMRLTATWTRSPKARWCSRWSRWCASRAHRPRAAFVETRCSTDQLPVALPPPRRRGSSWRRAAIRARVRAPAGAGSTAG